MNANTFCIFDLETTGIFPLYDEPIQFSAIPINPRTLKTYKDNVGNDIVFDSLSKIPDEKLALMQSTEEGKKSLARALEINKKSLEEVQAAPEQSVVFENFCNFIWGFSSKKSDAWRNPIPVGYNINSFDLVMIERLCKTYKKVDTNGNANLFHKNLTVDLMQMMFLWHENNNKLSRLNLDSVRKYMGLSDENAHDGLFDCYTCKHIFSRLMSKQRIISTKVILEDCFKINPLSEDER